MSPALRWHCVAGICSSTFKALYKSYANIMAKSFPFSIPNVIANAKTMQLLNSQLGAGCPQSGHLHAMTGREGPSAPS